MLYTKTSGGFQAVGAKASDTISVTRYVTAQPDGAHRTFDLAAAAADMGTSGSTLVIPQDGFVYTPLARPVLLNKNTVISGSSDAGFRYEIVGNGTLQLPSGMSSGDALLLRNRNADGSAIAANYGEHPRVVIRGIRVLGGSSPNGTFLDSYRSSVVLDRVRFNGLKWGVVTDGYNDRNEVNVYAENMTSGGWVFEQNYPGDGGRFSGMFYACAGLSILKNNGAVVQSLIGGWHEFIESDVHLSAVHVEGDGLLDANTNPLISCQGSRMYFASGAIFCSSLRPAIEINDSDGTAHRHSSVTIDREFYFQQRLDDPGSAKGNRQGVAVNIKQPAKETELKMRGVRCRIFKQNATLADVGFDYVAPIITTPNSTTDEQSLLTVLNARKPLWAADMEVRYRNAAWEVDAPEPLSAFRTTRRSTSPVFVSAAASNPMTSGWTNLSAATYYYKAYTIDAENRSTAVTSEVSATTTSPSPVPKLTFNAYLTPCRLRILRGTTTGTYTHWVEILLAKETAELYDQGDAIAGIAWTTTSVPTPPTVNSTYNGWVTRGANAVIYGSSTPTDGAWVVGDVMWNTGAAAGGSPGWICTAAGTPGTWKAMAAVAA